MNRIKIEIELTDRELEVLSFCKQTFYYNYAEDKEINKTLNKLNQIGLIYYYENPSGWCLNESGRKVLENYNNTRQSAAKSIICDKCHSNCDGECYYMDA